MQLWDPSRSERLSRSFSNMYRRYHGVFLVFDLASSESFYRVGEHMRQIKLAAAPHIVILLVGNKADLCEVRQVFDNEIINMAEELGVQYFEVSALSGSMVEECFWKMIELVHQGYGQILQEQGHHMPNRSNPSVQLENNSLYRANESCC